MKMLNELNQDSYKVVRPINKGWSSDKKYYIETKDNQKLLMRISDASFYENKKQEFEMMKKVFALGIPMSRPIDFGICQDKKHAYTLLSWIDGDDAETALLKLETEHQYKLGYESGANLGKMHTIKAPNNHEKWGSRYNKKIDRNINSYNYCNIKIPNGDKIVEYINANRHLIKSRPQCFHHGDYHIGNMILSKNNKLSIIDFNRFDFGDPWEEFNRIPFSAIKSPAFTSGIITGYFKGNVPDGFFKLLALYICVNTLGSISWAINYGNNEIETMLGMANQILSWYDNMNSCIPLWYTRS